jgi:hypothetical protein
MNQAVIFDVDGNQVVNNQVRLSQEYVRFDFKVNPDELQTVITLKPNQHIHSLFVENIKSFESWELLFDKIYLTRQDVVAVYAHVTMPDTKFRCYNRLLMSGRAPLYLVDPVFPYGIYAKTCNESDLNPLPGTELWTVYQQRYAFENDTLRPRLTGIENYTETVLKTVKGLALININNTIYEKPPVLWAQIITIE